MPDAAAAASGIDLGTVEGARAAVNAVFDRDRQQHSAVGCFDDLTVDGDLGHSIFRGAAAAVDLRKALPATLILNPIL